jgi:hypothetical protein
LQELSNIGQFFQRKLKKSNPNILWKFGQALDTIEKLLIGGIS